MSIALPMKIDSAVLRQAKKLWKSKAEGVELANATIDAADSLLGKKVKPALAMSLFCVMFRRIGAQNIVKATKARKKTSPALALLVKSLLPGSKLTPEQVQRFERRAAKFLLLGNIQAQHILTTLSPETDASHCDVTERFRSAFGRDPVARDLALR